MIFRLLGPVDVWAHGRSHPVGHAKAQTILSILLLEAGRVVPVQTLAERLWGDEMPGQARETMQVYISRLRRSLRAAGDSGGVIVSAPGGGYRLDVEHDEIDAHRFGKLIASARSAAGKHDLQRARELLLQAESLWRGEPLEGLTGSWAATARQDLVKRRREGQLARIGLDLRIEANRDEAINELAVFIRAGRIDQNAIEMLMTALANAGRQDEALEVYRSARIRMREELGVEPRRELAELHLAILRGEPLAGRASAGPAARIGPLAPNTLDRNPAHLIGRDELLHQLMGSVAEDLSRPQGIALYAIDGMPGIGKTALALRAAHQLAPRCPDGALQVSFRTHDPRQNPLDSRTALVMLLEALGATVEELGRAASHDELAALWRRRTHGLRLLVVFDDVRDTDQILPLLPASAGSVVLATSRQRLAHLPDARHLTLSALNDLATTRLLSRVAERQFPGQSRDLRRFAAYCGGLPLAVTVAAAHLRAHPAWSLSDLVQRLENPPAGTADSISAPVHHAFELSYRNLTTRHRLLFWLAAHQPAPDLGVHAAAALLDIDTATADLLLETLVEHHLLEEVSRHRYRLHDVLRSFAARQPPDEHDDGEIATAVDRMICFYLAATAHAERTLRPTRRLPSGIPTSPLTDELGLDTDAGAHAWLERETANLLAIAAKTDIPGSLYAGLLAALLAPYFDRRGLWPQAVEILSRARRAVAPARAEQKDANFAQLLVHLTAAHMRTGALQQATESASEALYAWRRLHDDRGQADALLELGRIHWRSGRLQDAVAAYQDAEGFYASLRLPHGSVLANYHRAIVLFEQNHYADAVNAARRALEIVEDAADPALACEVLINLAELYQRTGQDQHAARYLERAREQGRGRTDPQWLAALALNTGILAHRAGNDALACESLSTALDLYRVLGDRDYQLQTLTALAAAHTAGSRATADAYLRQAEELLGEGDEPKQRARIEITAAGIVAQQGRETDAMARLRTAIDISSHANAPLEEAHARLALSDILARRGDKIAARRQHRRAQGLYRHLGHANTG
ncbi:winged helix-turn-helix domain-containing protein [Actinospica sp. MGRD01-02]|uniref:Winged helix-turn-helix domain-containing protein n=1 Tax=Actinospica acidithermotolerans TaxID=2828514 RepID=A0A941ECN1_9ACTN|nr:BTAD domain-containing putative transcriptional regulator [Actinospica acidithermotolerans]MBR7828173.1 winged helix-turn-helix domain-containing protein [Actinospica acidithermotolerans]